MQIKKLKLGIILSGLSVALAGTFSPESAMAFSGGAHAMRCDACSNPTIMTTLASDYPTYGSQFVYSLDGQQWVRYFERQGKPGGGFMWHEVTIDPSVTAYFQLVRQWYAGNGNSMVYVDSLSLTLPKSAAAAMPINNAHWGAEAAAAKPFAAQASSSISAYDAVNEGAYRDQVAAYLNTNSSPTTGGIWVRAAQAVGMTYGNVRALLGADDVASVRMGIQSLGAFVDVKFPDGSSMRYGWDPASHGFLYVPHTAKDASGNQIPDAPADVGGVAGSTKLYVFPATPQGSADAISFFQRVNLMWHVQSPSPSTPSVWACTSVSGVGRCTLSR